MPLRRVLLPALAIILSACRNEAPQKHADVSGPENAKPAWTDGRGWTVGSTPLAVIGDADGDDASTFSGVAGALVLTNGTVVVADRGSSQVRYYTRFGRHLASVGRKGGGPGEYRVIGWIGERGDSVLVWDPAAARLTVLSPDRRVAREVIVAAATRGYHEAIGLMGDGSLLLRPRSEGIDRPAGEYTDSATYLRVSVSTGSVSGSLGPFLSGEHVTARVGPMSLTDDVIFGRNGVLLPGPRGFFTGETNAFQLTARSYDGAAVRTFGRPHSRVLASGTDVRSALEQRRSDDIVKTFPQMARVQQELLEHLPHRDTLPAFTRAVLDSDGNVWMEEFRIDHDAPGVWSVFDANGRWLGRVETPARVRVLYISYDAVLGVTKDELGVERVVVYPLAR